LSCPCANKPHLGAIAVPHTAMSIRLAFCNSNAALPSSTLLALGLHSRCRDLVARSCWTTTCAPHKALAVFRPAKFVACTHKAAASSDVTARTFTFVETLKAASLLLQRHPLVLQNPLSHASCHAQKPRRSHHLGRAILSTSTTTSRVASQRARARCTPHLGRRLTLHQCPLQNLWS